MGKARNWTKEEIEYLQDNYGQLSYGTLAKNLNRSSNAINVMARRLELGAFLECGDYVTWNQLLIALGYGNSGYNYKMISWAKNRDFPVHYKRVNKNRFKVVYLDEFWEWAEKNQDLLDFSRFEENDLGAEPDWVKRKRKLDFKKSMKYKQTPWTKQEDEKLRRLVSQHRYTYDDISKKLGRTCGAVQRRLCDLGIKDRPIKADNHNPWGEDDLQLLGELIKHGYNYDLIAEEIGRSSKAIRGLVYRYYITENLDKVRAYMQDGAFGDNCPEKKIKHFKIMNTEERNQVRELIARLAGILDVEFHNQINETEWGEFFQKDMCQNFGNQCLQEGIGCDACTRYKKIAPQACKMCGGTFYEKKSNLYCKKCRDQRRRNYLKKKSVLNRRKRG